VWLLQDDRNEEVLQLVKGVGYYYYVRGLWNKEPPINIIAADAARSLGRTEEEVRFLSFQVQTLCRQSEVDKAELMLPRLRQLAESTRLSEPVLFEYNTAITLYLAEKEDWDSIEAIWDYYRKQSNYPSGVIGAKNWRATRYYKQGALDQAEIAFLEVLENCRQNNVLRGVISVQVRLVEIELDKGNFEKAAEILSEVEQQSSNIRDNKYLAMAHLLRSRLSYASGKYAEALQQVSEAIEKFERLGMVSYYKLGQDLLHQFRKTNTT